VNRPGIHQQPGQHRNDYAEREHVQRHRDEDKGERRAAWRFALGVEMREMPNIDVRIGSVVNRKSTVGDRSCNSIAFGLRTPVISTSP